MNPTGTNRLSDLRVKLASARIELHDLATEISSDSASTTRRRQAIRRYSTVRKEASNIAHDLEGLLYAVRQEVTVRERTEAPQKNSP
jgi:hypothetical protein